MKALFNDVGYLDKRLIDEFGLSEDLMMEHAANSLNVLIRKKLKKHKKILIICGSGNNGADGLACARMLANDYNVSVLLPLGIRSNMCKIQLKRLQHLNINFVKKIRKADAYIDAIFGSGLNRPLNDDVLELIGKLNGLKGLKLACDMPSGVMRDGSVFKNAFIADKTISMGALKIGLFGDEAKDYVGKISICDLGVSRKIYELTSDSFILQKKDLVLPKRKLQNVNKGNFGHLAVVSGKMKGASLLTAKAGFYFGAGLVSLIGKNISVPNYLMTRKDIPKNATALAIGMGLGEVKKVHLDLTIKTNIPMVLDADLLNSVHLKQILKAKDDLVLTPHPKEFVNMLKNLEIGEYDVKYIQKHRFALAKEFSLKFNQVLVLKGANTIIANKGKCYVSQFGSLALSKGGSGDVLSGLIASLLAQKYTLLDSAISGVLAHGLASKKFKKNNFSLNPNDIIKAVRKL